MSIAQMAGGNPDVSTLVAAVTAAGLLDTFSNPGEYTVFGPTNAAFAKLPAGTVEDLLKPENVSKLQDILKYHVVGMKALKDGLQDGMTVDTLQGGKLAIHVSDAGVQVEDAQGNMANVVVPDMVANNGVVHVIDTVLMP